MPVLRYWDEANREHQQFFDDSRPVSVGRDPRQVDLSIPNASLSEMHAKLTVSGEVITVECLTRGNGITEDGSKWLFNFGDTLQVRAGRRFFLAAVPVVVDVEDFVAGDEAGPNDLRLLDWWARGQEARGDDFDHLWRQMSLCGTQVVQRLGNAGKTRVANWYRGYLSNRFGVPPLMPVCLPIFADLTALVMFPQPPYKPIRSGDSERDEYVAFVLRELGSRPLVATVRERMQLASEEFREVVCGQFVRMVFDAVNSTWLRADAVAQAGEGAPEEQIGEIQKGLLRKGEGPLRCLREASLVRGFRGRLTGLVKAGGIGNAISKLDSFLLFAGCLLEYAFAGYDAELIQECLDSADLDEEDYKVIPVRLDTSYPDVTSPLPGDQQDIYRIRSTTELEKLRELIPQELVFLRSGTLVSNPTGHPPRDRRIGQEHRHFLHKFVNEGALIWERRQRVRAVTRERIFVCFVADNGTYARTAQARDHNSGTSLRVDANPIGMDTSTRFISATVHAKRLIFDGLRDIAANADHTEMAIDFRIFIEPVGNLGVGRLSWTTTLEELQALLDCDRYALMLQLEQGMPGYYFTAPGQATRSFEDHHLVISDAVSFGGYELALLVFLGPLATARSALVPDDPPGDDTSRCRRIAQLVHVGRWRDWVETASAETFDELRFGAQPEIMHDLQFRYSLLEALLGERMRTHEQSAPIELHQAVR